LVSEVTGGGPEVLFRLEWDGPGAGGAEEVATARAASDRYVELLAERRLGLRVRDEAGEEVKFSDLLRLRQAEAWS
jgi:hypothetical protein